MIYFIKKYWKQVLVLFFFVIFLLFIYLSNKYNKVSTTSVKKQSITKEVSIAKNDTTKTVFVDVKGAVNAPGVYELEDGKRIIDAINLAGGLSDNANTINLNLSKKLTDEMYIVVYTKKEISEFKKNSISKEITCASNECICPDSNNDACINKSSSLENKSNDGLNSKVSINNASKEELMTLSGIGEAKADAIISYRQENGSFKSIEEIKNVSGVGDSIYEKIKDYITL